MITHVTKFTFLEILKGVYMLKIVLVMCVVVFFNTGCNKYKRDIVEKSWIKIEYSKRQSNIQDL